jgi:glycosyltransferase involved in cell wall biosynthesis
VWSEESCPSYDVTTTRTLYVDARHLERSPTGVGVWLRSILEEWARVEPGPEVRLLTRAFAPHPEPLRLEPIALPSAAWHLAAAWRTLRSRGRYLSPDSFLVPILLGGRATLVVHDLTPLVLPQAHTRRSRLSHRLLLRLAARRAGVVVVPSTATRDDLLAMVPSSADRVRVVPEAARRLPMPSVDAELPDESTPYVLYVGTVEPRKNVDVLVRSFRRSAPPGWKLLIAGKLGWLSPEAKQQLLHDIGDDGRVRLLGYVDDARLGSLYRHAALFVYPSSYEGFGLPVLEAMASGVPTITTDASALVEVAGGAARCVPLRDLEAGLGEALVELTAAPAARDLLAAAGRARAAEFTWEAVAGAILDLATQP